MSQPEFALPFFDRRYFMPPPPAADKDAQAKRTPAGFAVLHQTSLPTGAPVFEMLSLFPSQPH
jgi:hypothetical protein